MEKDSKDREESTLRITGGKSCPSESLKDFYARPPVSASHIIQTRNDLFIGKEEAYNMNRKSE